MAWTTLAPCGAVLAALLLCAPVPGMPIGSPGMEVKGRTADPFAVMAIAHDGSTTVFERY